VFRNGQWLLRNSNTPGVPDLNFSYGERGDIPVMGDWTGPLPTPTELDFTFPDVTFSGGVPIGGNATVKLHQDGRFEFSGHFHNSSVVPFSYGIAIGVRDRASRGLAASTLSPISTLLAVALATTISHIREQNRRSLTTGLNLVAGRVRN